VSATQEPTARRDVSAVADGRPGTILFKIKPWADVSVDGGAAARAQRLTLPPGRHLLVFTHPDYEPLRRAITVTPGEPLTITIDMRDEALKKRR